MRKWLRVEWRWSSRQACHSGCYRPNRPGSRSRQGSASAPVYSAGAPVYDIARTRARVSGRHLHHPARLRNKNVARWYPALVIDIGAGVHKYGSSVVDAATVRESRERSQHACRRVRRIRHVSCTVGPVDDRASPTQMAPALLCTGRVETLDASILRDPVTMIPSVREATCAR